MMTAAADWSPWRPAHIHLIVSAEGHEPLVTQLFIDSSDYLRQRRRQRRQARADRAPRAGGDGGYAFTYDFALAPVRAPAVA